MSRQALVASAMVLALLVSRAEARKVNGFDLDGASIPVDEIVSGGVPRDAIPAINHPKFVTASAADFLEADDRVLAVRVNGQPKAYPIKILNWHEVVNDKTGRQYFVVSYCPLCGTGMVFASNIAEAALLFGVSGLLYNSDVLLFDRNTESLWSQILGASISGRLKGLLLPQIPAFHTTWKDWRARHPDTLVLSTDTGYPRDYQRNPYQGYQRNRKLFFEVSHRAPRDYHPKALVMGVAVDGSYKAYPFKELAARGQAKFEDELNGKTINIHWNAAASSAYVTDAKGKALPSTIGFWFAWYTFYPETQVFKAD